MPVETPSLFAQVIQDHLELRERNAKLESTMPLTHYKTEDPFDNHPLFKTEEQARLEETMDGVESPVAAESTTPPPAKASDHVRLASSESAGTSFNLAGLIVSGSTSSTSPRRCAACR